MDSPLFAYMLLAAGMLASLFLFFSLKYEIRAVERRDQRAFEEIRDRLLAADRGQHLLPPAVVAEPAVHGIVPALRSAFNMNRRVQAMRLMRKGEDAAHIAAALGVPQKEVDLLVRVQQMAAGAGAGASAINVIARGPR